MIPIKPCAVLLFFFLASVSAQRIQQPPPDANELARIALDQAMNDGSLQPGDIIATSKGFLRFLGMRNDGSFAFEPVRAPFSQEPPRKKRKTFRSERPADVLTAAFGVSR